MKNGNSLRVVVESVSSDGKGIARMPNGKVLFVAGGLPEEELEVVLLRESRDYAVAGIENIITKNRRRVSPICPWHHACGGCRLQHAAYELQLDVKKRIVQDALGRIAKLEPVCGIDECVPSPRAWNYRNKASFPVRGGVSGMRMGFYKEGTHDLAPIDACPVMEKKIETLFRQILDILPEMPLPPYDEKNHSGLLRHIVLRSGSFTGDSLVGLVCREFPATKAVDRIRDLFHAMGNNAPRGLCINRNREKSNVILGSDVSGISGEITVRERLDPYLFRYGLTDFFQVNSFQAKRLYAYAAEQAGTGGSLLELYAGIGTLTMYLAPAYHRITAVEEWPTAGKTIAATSSVNRFSNIASIVGSAENVLRELPDRYETVVVDPPRTGCDRSVLEAIANVVTPQRIVYVSCNPATLSRDVRILHEKGFVLERLRPFDMFPQTMHVECVATLVSDRGIKSS